MHTHVRTEGQTDLLWFFFVKWSASAVQNTLLLYLVGGRKTEWIGKILVVNTWQCDTVIPSKRSPSCGHRNCCPIRVSKQIKAVRLWKLCSKDVMKHELVWKGVLCLARLAPCHFSERWKSDGRYIILASQNNCTLLNRRLRWPESCWEASGPLRKLVGYKFLHLLRWFTHTH